MSLVGIDVSRYQAGLDLAGTGAQFAIIKASGGDAGLYTDPLCNTHFANAKSHNLLRGLYHFAGTNNAVQEADYFINAVRGYIGDAVFVLDFEGEAVNQGVNWAKTWLDHVAQVTGVKPLIYMSAAVISRFDWSSVAGTYKLWVAGYPDGRSSWSIPAFPYKVAPWPSYTLWQYTSSSGTLDRDVFAGDANLWNQLKEVTVMIEDTDVWFTRMSQVVYQITHQTLSRDEFKTYVGRNPWDVTTDILDDTNRSTGDETATAQQLASLTNQVNNLTSQVSALSQRPTQAQLDALKKAADDANAEVATLQARLAAQAATQAAVTAEMTKTSTAVQNAATPPAVQPQTTPSTTQAAASGSSWGWLRGLIGMIVGWFTPTRKK